jgi:hypothetical protein
MRIARYTWVVAAAAICLSPLPALGFPTYDAGCIDCHGDFRAQGYVSLKDGTAWSTSLMSGHTTFTNSCDTCHFTTSRTPVFTNISNGTAGLKTCRGGTNDGAPCSAASECPSGVCNGKGCIGCHGRDQDVTDVCTGLGATFELDCGSGAGLRQVHEQSTNPLAGPGTCSGCHAGDATPVAENVLPFDYGKTGISLSDPCADAKFGPTATD